MGSSKLFLSFSLAKLILLLALLTPTISAANSNHFAEYIIGVPFTDVPINPYVDFHFILAFAADYSGGSSPAPTNGQFNIFWDSSNLSPSAVAAIKQSNPNVKVAVSLGGGPVSGQPVHFTPTSVDSWVSNAVSSLTSIIQQYNLDGIDVYYENFQSDTDTDTFAQCIGQLITALKSNGVISFASIAPFHNSDGQSYYQALWASYGSVIDYVNFQFYAYSPSTTVDQYLSYYNAQTEQYNGGTILASFTTYNSPNWLSADTGLSACKSLHAEGSLPGIFIWSADDSQSEGFTYETQAQALLVDS